MLSKRLHLFEFEDQNWCPGMFRNTITELLQVYINLLNVYQPAFKKIKEVIVKQGVRQIIDLCSGSGGPLGNLSYYLVKEKKLQLPILLTDKYPNINRFKLLESSHPERIKALSESIDATQVPAQLQGMRTLFTSFHHFKPAHAKQILQDAVDKGVPIGIFEFTERSVISTLRMLLSPVLAMVLVPFTKSVSLKKLFWTYVIPVIPILLTWDGIVSNFRTYSPKELKEMVSQLNASHYHWEIGKVFSKKALCNITYCIGYHKQ